MRNTQKYIKLNKNENKPYEKLWNTKNKTESAGIVLKVYIRKEVFKINNLNGHLKKVEKGM